MTFVKPTLSAPEAANLMNVHVNTIFKLIEAGSLPAAKIGRAYVLLMVDVMEYVQNTVLQQTSQRNGSPHLLRKVRRPQVRIAQ